MASTDRTSMAEAPEPLVATVLGWGCCCDIELSQASGNAWGGSALAGRGDSGIRFDMEYVVHDGADARCATLRAVLSGRGRSCEISSSAPPGDAFSLDVADFFGKPDPGRDGIPRNRMHILIGGNARAKRMFGNAPFGLSYMPVVFERYRQQAPPRRILEWGPGRSTVFFAELFPEAVIEGVEHDAGWHSKCLGLASLFPGRVSVVHRHLQIVPGKSEAYVSYPLYRPERKFDLIFIDGRLRADCAAIARFALERGGAVLVHDAHRENYRPAYQLYGTCRIVYDTAILER